MSWETMINQEEKADCACGNGIITRHYYSEMDDWNRIRSGHSKEQIQCTNCSSKYHIEQKTIQTYCPPWKGDSTRTITYLVPNGFTIHHNTTQKRFDFDLDEIIVSSFEKQSLQKVIDDMVKNKYSTRLELKNSINIVDLYFNFYRKRSLPNIIKLLKQCLLHYDSYEWSFDKMNEYRQQEQKQIDINTKTIEDVMNQSYKLNFKYTT